MSGRMVARLILFTLVCFSLIIPTQPTIAQDAPCYGGEGATVTIIGIWKTDDFVPVLSELIDECGLEIYYMEGGSYGDLRDMYAQAESEDDFPDITMVPELPIMAEWVGDGYLEPLPSVLVDSGLLDNYSAGWENYTTVAVIDSWDHIDPAWYALPVEVHLLPLVWYRPSEFDAAGYSVPATLDDFVALMDTMVSNGHTPLNMGFRNSSTTVNGFVSDLLMRAAGADFVLGLAAGASAWESEEMFQAWGEYLSWIDAYGLGGAEGAVNTRYWEATLDVFGDSPESYMVRQSDSVYDGPILNEFPDYVYGEDYAFFVLPSNSGEAPPMLVSGKFLVAVRNTPGVIAVMTYLASADGANAFARSGLGVSPNLAVDHDSYPSDVWADLSRALADTPRIVYAPEHLFSFDGTVGDFAVSMPNSIVSGEMTIEDALAEMQYRFDVDRAEFDTLAANVLPMSSQDKGPGWYASMSGTTPYYGVCRLHCRECDGWLCCSWVCHL